MILRSRRGAVRAQDARRYPGHEADMGVDDLLETDGNLGALVRSRQAVGSSGP